MRLKKVRDPESFTLKIFVKSLSRLKKVQLWLEKDDKTYRICSNPPLDKAEGFSIVSEALEKYGLAPDASFEEITKKISW